MDWLIYSGLFVISVAVLVKSADFFVDAADKAGSMLGVPAFVMGITLVALGTSLPELAASLVAVSRDKTEFIVGNAVGSNVTNILLVLGATGLAVKNYTINRNMMRLDLPALFLSTAVLTLFCLTGRMVGRWEGAVLMGGYVLYLVLLILNRRLEEPAHKTEKKIGPWLILALSGVGIYFGAEYTLVATIELSKLAGFADTSVLALSAVAVGTSLPELTVSVTAAKKGQLELAVGNVVGSNIFNALVVVGLPALAEPLIVSDKTVSIGLTFMALATTIAGLTLARRRVARLLGLIMVLLFAAFTVALFLF